jgi:hypothetical protein
MRLRSPTGDQCRIKDRTVEGPYPGDPDLVGVFSNKLPATIDCGLRDVSNMEKKNAKDGGLSQQLGWYCASYKNSRHKSIIRRTYSSTSYCSEIKSEIMSAGERHC